MTTPKAHSEDAARAARAAADRWRIVTGFYVSDAGNRVVIRLSAAQADAVLDDVIRGRNAPTDDDFDGAA